MSCISRLSVRQLGSGEAAREAVVDAILDRDDRAAAIDDIWGSARTRPRAARRSPRRPFVEVAARAVQIAADIRREAVARVRDEREAAVDRRLERIVRRAVDDRRLPRLGAPGAAAARERRPRSSSRRGSSVLERSRPRARTATAARVARSRRTVVRSTSIRLARAPPTPSRTSGRSAASRR